MGPMLFLFAFILINFSRLVNIYAITRICNITRNTSKIDQNSIFIMWFSGFRGAMAFALSLKSAEMLPE
jgi:sodium/hydrogen exchanger 8